MHFEGRADGAWRGWVVCGEMGGVRTGPGASTTPLAETDGVLGVRKGGSTVIGHPRGAVAQEGVPVALGAMAEARSGGTAFQVRACPCCSKRRDWMQLLWKVERSHEREEGGCRS